MNLSVSERYALLALLPAEGTFTTLKIVRKLRESLSFTEDEIKLYNLKENVSPDGQLRVSWDANAAEAEIELGEKATDLIVEALKKRDKEGKITDREFTLYEKFVEK